MAKADPKRIVLPEGEHEKILRAAQMMIEEGIALPILLGNRELIGKKMEELRLDLNGVSIIDPDESPETERYAQLLFQLRQRKGVTLSEARRKIRRKAGTYFGSIMVHLGDADALLSGIDAHYPDIIRPALEVIGKRDGLSSVHGLYMMVFKKGVFFLADATVCIDPTSEELAETAILAAEMARMLEIEPRIAMLSFSNFGSVKHPHPLKVKRAVEIVKERAPQLVVDGEMQADTAVTAEILAENYPFSALKGAANVLIFPDLTSGNICYKLLNRLGGAEAIGPILMGMKKPIHVLQRGDDVADIVNMAAIAVVDAQNGQR
jgi:malate dehydrogenase (oxaloacetate-decarboxylating)(NADP+)